MHGEERESADLGPRAILIVEDSDADVYFLRRAIAQSGVINPVFVVKHGAQAIEYLAGEGVYADRAVYPLPGIVFLDLRLPVVDGFAVLAWKSSQSLCRDILFVALSNHDDLPGINQAYKLGAGTFLTKPLDADQIRVLIEAFESFKGIQRRAREKQAS